MSAGGSDYSSVATGGIGQGFAGGVESGLQQYNRGVDKKVAQANMYLKDYIAPNLEKLSKPIPRPPANATKEEFDMWAKSEQARRSQKDILLGQSAKYLEMTGNVLSVEEWSGLFYDPSSEIPADEWSNLLKNKARFDTLTENVATKQRAILQIDPLKNPQEYKLAVDELNKYKEENGYAELYKQQRGADYIEIIGGEAEAEARRNDSIYTSDVQFINNARASLKSPEAQAITDLLLSNPNIKLNDKHSSGKTYRELLTTAIDTEGLDNLIDGGTAQSITVAMHRIQMMNPEQLSSASEKVKSLNAQYQAYKENPDAFPPGAVKDAFNQLKISDMKVASGQQELDMGGIKLKIAGVEYQTKSREYYAGWEELASRGIGSIFTQKPQFEDEMRRQGYSPEQIEEAWGNLSKSYDRFIQKATTEQETANAELVGLSVRNAGAIETTIKDGRFHLSPIFSKDSEGNVIINRDSEAYKRIVAIEGFTSDAQADAYLMNRYTESETNFNNLSEEEKNRRALGAAQVTLTQAQATGQQIENEWRPKLLKLQADGMTTDNSIKEIQLEIEKAAKPGKVAMLLAEAVSVAGVGILDDPAFRASFASVLGEDGVALAQEYLTAREEYKVKREANALTIEGQQITSTAIDNFNKIFASEGSIRSYAGNQAAVAELARAAGIDPNAAWAAVQEVASNSREYTRAQLDNMHFELYAGQEGLRLQGRQVAVAEGNLALEWANRYDRNTQWSAEFAYRIEHDAAVLAQSGQATSMQYNAMVIAPLREQIELISKKKTEADIRRQELIAAAPDQYEQFLTNNLTFEKVNGNWVPKTDAAHQPTLDAIMRSNPALIKNIGKAYADSQTYSWQMDVANGTLKKVLDIGLSQLGLDTGVVENPARIPTTVGATVGTTTQAYKPEILTSMVNGNTATKEGKLAASAVQSFLNGTNNPVYGAARTDFGYCNTFTQGILNAITTLPSGAYGPVEDGGAVTLRQKLVANGGKLVGGSGKSTQAIGTGSLTPADLSKLPEFAVLIQDTIQTQNHSAVLINGWVYQNAIENYGKPLRPGSPMSVMSFADFVRAAPTSAVVLPQSAFKQSGSTGRTPTATGGGTTTASSGYRPKSATEAARTYTTTDGSFAPAIDKVSYLVSDLYKNNGVRMVSSPGGTNGGLTMRMGDNRYAKILTPQGNLRIVSEIGTQFGRHMSAATGKSLGAAYKENPTKVRNALRSVLKDAGISGDIDGYLTKWFSSKGW